MKKFSLFAILLGFNIALGACSDDDAAPVVKDQIFQLPEKAYVPVSYTHLTLPTKLEV